jgi:hypothetical protein
MSSTWKKCFPSEYNEVEYGKNNSCTFEIIIDLIERKTSKKLTINQIKNDLFEEYKKYLDEYTDKIVDILILEGKKTLGDQVHAETLSFSNLIYTDNYFLTTFDLWLLVKKYNIPTIFICQKYILQTKYEKSEFVGYSDEEDKYAFIVIPGFRPENIPNYKLIQSDKNEVFISLDKLNDDCVERIREAISNKISIEEYLEHFTKAATTKYQKKKPKKLIIDGEVDSEEKPKTKKKIIIQNSLSSSSPITPEDFLIIPKGKKSRKKLEIKGEKPKTRKYVKKPKMVIEKKSNSDV